MASESGNSSGSNPSGSDNLIYQGSDFLVQWSKKLVYDVIIEKKLDYDVTNWLITS